jgi:hypothetical protein
VDAGTNTWDLKTSIRSERPMRGLTKIETTEPKKLLP